MSTAVGYGNFGDNKPTTQVIHRVMQRVFDAANLKFGGFNYQPVIWKIPAGYAKTGAYMRQSGADTTSGSNDLFIGFIDFDTLGDRQEMPYSVPLADETIIFAYGDTGELIVFSSRTIFALELLDPSTLSSIGYMLWHNSGNHAIFCESAQVYQGDISIINSEPIRIGDSVKVSRIYFETPLGIVTTRRLYAMVHDRVKYNLCVQVGTSKFISVGNYLVDVTDEV